MPTFAALFCSYTGIGFALWGAFFGAAAGAVGGLLFGSAVSGLAGQAGEGPLGAASSATWLELFGGAVLGAATAFIGTLGAILTHPLALLGAIVSGAVIGGLLTAFGHVLEPALLRMRGYRRLSREEASQLVPLLHEVATAMRVPPVLVPTLAIADTPLPEAVAHLRTITVTKGWLQLYPATEERIAVLAHELHHVRSMHPLGVQLVQACALPTVLVYNLGVWLARLGSHVGSASRGFIGLLGWVFLWPAWVEIRLVIVPLLTRTQRAQEYEADQAAVRLGYGEGLRKALLRLRDWEAVGTGWQQALAATHPPIALRLEAIDPDRFEARFQQTDLAPWLPRFVARAALIVTVLAIILAIVGRGIGVYLAAHPGP